MRTGNEPATSAQVDYILNLARKSNLHDQTLTDEDLRKKFLSRGINLDQITKADAAHIIDDYKKKLDWTASRMGVNKRRFFGY